MSKPETPAGSPHCLTMDMLKKKKSVTIATVAVHTRPGLTLSNDVSLSIRS